MGDRGTIKSDDLLALRSRGARDAQTVDGLRRPNSEDRQRVAYELGRGRDAFKVSKADGIRTPHDLLVLFFQSQFCSKI